MAKITRKQYIVNLHTNKNGNYSGDTALVDAIKEGEIIVQNNSGETGAAIYTLDGPKADSNTRLARFIPEETILSLINSAAAASTTQVLKATGDTQFTGLTITSALNQTTSAAVYTISLVNVAEADELDAVEEGVGLGNDGTYVAPANANYINSNNTDSVMSAVTVLDTKLGELSAATTSAITNLDYTDTAATGQFVTKVDEIDGVIRVSRSIVTDEYLKIVSATPSSTNVKEEFMLVNGANTKLGESIKIYKDSSLAEVYLGHVDDRLTSTGGTGHTTGSGDTALCFIYHKEDGTYELVPVDVETFLSESEFGDGLQVNNHEVSVKIDNTTGVDPYLTVSSDGIRLSGITAAIEEAKAASTTKVVEGTDNANVMTIASAVSVSDSSTTYTISLSDVATTTAVGLATDGTHVRTSGKYTSAATTIAGEIAALETALIAASASSKTEVVEGTDTASVMAISASTGADGHAIYTIHMTNVAKADAVGLGTNGAYTAPANANYINSNNTDSVMSAVTVLDTKLYELSAATESVVEGLDYTDTADTKMVVTKVDEANGKIEVSRDYLASSQVTLGIVHGTNAETVQLKNGHNDVIGSAAFSAATGVAITNGVIHGVVDQTSEDFLTVGAGGFKLAGVQDAIDAAKSAATTVVTEGTDNPHLTITSASAATGTTYTVTLTDVASDTALTQVSGWALSNIVVNDVTGTVANNVASVTIDSDDVKVGTAINSGSGTGATPVITTASSITEALQFMQNEIDDASKDAVEDVVVTGFTVNPTKTVSEVGGNTTVTFDFNGVVIDGGEF